ncbi:MAG: IS110 family transposase [Candidatus Thermoplasmatota archaeon]|nr:IS110 family transposase [Candidatus Thermoplasmatota archaeon]
MDKEKKRNKRMNSPVVGIDIGEEKSFATYLAPDGDVRDSFDFPMDMKGYADFAFRIPPDTRIVFEASGSAYSFSRTMKDLGYCDLTVAHPKEIAWITKSKRKNDEVDSLKLARLHLVNMIPESHLLDEDDRIFRDLLIQRVELSQSVASTKNGIIGYLKREGLYGGLPESSESFSEKRRGAMKKIRFGNQKDLVLKTLMDRLDFQERQIIPLETEIKRMARESGDVRLLMSIPGIDYYLASLLSSYIGDIRRFDNPDKLAAYFGVIPATRDSSSIKRRGHMSKESPSTARWALSVAVDTVSLRNKPIKEYYQSVKNRKGSGKFAHVSTMRKLVRMIYTMLSERKEWKYANPAVTENKLSRLDEE